MSTIRKQSVFGAIFAVLGVFAGYLNSGLLQPLILSVEDYGIFKYILSITSLAVVISSFGIANVLLRFFPKYRGTSRESTFWKFIATHSGVGFVLGVIGLLSYLHFLQDELPRIYFGVVVFIYSGFFWFRVGLNLLNTLSKVSLVILIRDVILKLGFVVALGLTYFNALTFSSFLDLVVILYFVLALLLFASFLRSKPKPNDTDMDAKPWKLAPLISLGIYSMLTTSSALLVKELDVLMVTSLAGFKSTGIYGLMIFVAALVNVPSRGLVAVSSVRLGDAWSKNDLGFIQNLYYKTAKNQSFIGGFIFLMLLINLNVLWEVIPKSEIFKEGVWVVFWLGLGQIVDLSSGVSGEILNYSKKYKTGLFFSCLLILLMIVLNFILIPIYGMSGAAFATFVSQVVHNFLRGIYLFSKFRLKPFDSGFRFVFFLFLFLFSLVMVANYFNFGTKISSSIILSTVLSITYGYFLLKGPWLPDLKDRLKVYFYKIGINIK